MLCWETLGPAIHVDVTLTHTTFLSIVADHVHPFMETVLPDGSGLFQQDNAPCHKAGMVQEWFEEHNSEFEMLTPNYPDINPVGYAGQTSLIHGGPTSQLRQLKVSVANILMPDTTAHLQGSICVQA